MSDPVAYPISEEELSELAEVTAAVALRLSAELENARELRRIARANRQLVESAVAQFEATVAIVVADLETARGFNEASEKLNPACGIADDPLNPSYGVAGEPLPDILCALRNVLGRLAMAKQTREERRRFDILSQKVFDAGESL